MRVVTVNTSSFECNSITDLRAFLKLTGMLWSTVMQAKQGTREKKHSQHFQPNVAVSDDCYHLLYVVRYGVAVVGLFFSLPDGAGRSSAEETPTFVETQFACFSGIRYLYIYQGRGVGHRLLKGRAGHTTAVFVWPYYCYSCNSLYAYSFSHFIVCA